MSSTYSLAASITAGATQITLTGVDYLLQPGMHLVLSPFAGNSTCEIRAIKAVSGSTITVVNPYAYDHAEGDKAFIILGEVRADIRWFDAEAEVSGLTPIDNRLPLQRAMEDARGDRGKYYRVYAPAGVFGIGGPIYHDPDVVLEGDGANLTEFYAFTTFDFGAPNSDIFMFSGRRPGEHPSNPGEDYFSAIAGGPTLRAPIVGCKINGNNAENGRGLRYIVQQPIDWENLRVQDFEEFGVLLSGQQASVDNLMILRCGTNLWLKDFGEVHLDTLNLENATGTHMKIENCNSVVISELHIEGQPGSGICVQADSTTNGVLIQGGIISSGGTLFQFNGCDWTLESIVLNGSPSAIAVEDTAANIQRTIEFYGKEIKIASNTPDVASPQAPPSIHILGPSGGEIRMGAHAYSAVGFVRSEVEWGIGVEGVSGEGTGIKGSATTGHGVDGSASDTGGAGVHAESSGGAAAVRAIATDGDSTALDIVGGVQWQPKVVNTSTYNIQKGDSLIVVTTVPCALTLPLRVTANFGVFRIVDAAGSSAANPITIYTQNNELIGGLNRTTTPLVLSSVGTNITIFNDMNQFRVMGGFGGTQVIDTDIASVSAAKILGPGLQYTLLSSGVVVPFTPTSGDPNAPDEFNASIGNRIDVSLEHVQKMRWSLNVPSAESGFTALCGIQYSLDNGSTWDWLDASFGNGIRVNSLGYMSANYATIASAARSATRALLRMAAFDSSGKRIDINSIHIYLN